MTSQPDKLFRDKLENFHKPAPAAAWNRIEAGLEKTSNKGLWMKIAAGLVLLAVAAILLWPSNNSDNSKLLANKTSAHPQPEVKQELSTSENSNNTAEPTPSRSSKKNLARSTKTKSVEKTHQAKEQQPELIAQVTEVSKQESEIENPESRIQNPESSAKNQESTIQLPTSNFQNPESTSKTIVYTVNEVNAKFLKKQSPVEATSDEKKSSGIQKLMGIAYNLKNSDSGLGDLRQKKDEILALNFLEKKQLSQN